MMDALVKEMLDVTFGTDLDLIVREELHKLPPCELTGHTQDSEWHDPTAPAAYWVIAPCGRERFACAKWVESEILAVFTLCQNCDDTHRSSEYRYIPIDK